MQRRLLTVCLHCRRALLGSLVVMGMLVHGTAAWAQDTSTSDAQRIAAQRDHAAAQPDVEKVDTQRESTAGTADVSGDVAAPAVTTANANESLPLGVGTVDLFQKGSGSSGRAGAAGDGWLLSTLAALGVVLAMVFAIRWVMRRSGVASKASPQGSVVEVLSRSTVAPRSHVLLMRIGSRILVVSDSTAGMRTLASIEDPVEVADLLGAVDASRSASISQTFSSAMKRISGQWSDSFGGSEKSVAAEAEADMEGVTAERTRSAVSSVRGRLAALSGTGGKA